MGDKNSVLLEALGDCVQRASGTRLQQIAKSPRKLLPILGRYLIALTLRRTRSGRATTFWGDEMSILIPAVSWYLLAYGYFEEGLTSIVLKYVGENQVFFDIGSHVGYYTLLACHLVGQDGQVHSFEPTPSTYAILQSNTAGRSNAFVVNCAAFSHSTTLPFYDYGPTHSAFNSFKRARFGPGLFKGPSPSTIDVPATTIDEHVASSKVAPDFVKVDAESAELEVLKGMRRTLADFRPIVTAEVGDVGVPGVSSGETIRFMLDQGYRAYEYRNREIIPHQMKGSYAIDNILFLPDELS